MQDGGVLHPRQAHVDTELRLSGHLFPRFYRVAACRFADDAARFKGILRHLHRGQRILKEILYAVMQDEGGDFIRQYVMDGSASQRVVQAITRIKENYKALLNVGELARAVSLSESSLCHNFKKITALSPLQFQKQLRLHEARQLLLTRDIEAAQVAYEVGYESPSQFSREYARMFGLPPKADTQEAMKR